MSGRGYHLRVGLAMARDYPLLGVGYDNYGWRYLEEYQYAVSGGRTLWNTARSAHNAYVQILADLGGIGLSLWFGMLGIIVFRVFQAWRYARSGRDRLSYYQVQAIGTAVALQVFAYGLYMQTHEEKILWILAGLTLVAARLVGSNAVEPNGRSARVGDALGWAQGAEAPATGAPRLTTGWATPQPFQK